MGLFWSMQPDKSQRSRSYFFTVFDWFKPVVTEFEAVSDTHVVGAAQSIRYFAGPDVRAEAFRRDGIVGILYKPAGGGRHRAIILLGGSEGGFPAPEGAMLASRGFLVLALAYFGTPDLPASMQRITIEYFGRAIHYLWSSPDVERAAVWIMGGSRGAEAALIAASTYPEIQGVVGVSSSNVRWEGATSNMRPGGPAWTYGGKPLP